LSRNTVAWGGEIEIVPWSKRLRIVDGFGSQQVVPQAVFVLPVVLRCGMRRGKERRKCQQNGDGSFHGRFDFSAS